MDLLSVINIAGAVQCVFVSLVFWKRVAGWKFLVLFLCAYAVVISGAVIFVNREVLEYPHLAQVHIPFTFLLGPSLSLFFQATLEKPFTFRWTYWLHFLPFLLAEAWLMPFYLKPAAIKQAYIEQCYASLPFDHLVLFFVAAFHACVYLAFTFWALNRHARRVKSYFSEIEKKSLEWARHFLLGVALVFLVCLVISIFDVVFADTFSNAMFTVLVFWMALKAIRQPEIFKNETSAVLEESSLETTDAARDKNKYEKSGFDDRRARQFQERLDKLMAESQLYLQPDLDLKQLSEAVGLSVHHLSQLINQYNGETFYDYINRMRVAYFKQAVLDPENDHLSLLGLAFESGFNSKTAFNTAFKRYAGMTPTAFKQQSLSDKKQAAD